MTQGAGPLEPPATPATAKLPDADPSALTDAFRSGQLALQAGQRVGVRGPDGSVGTVAAEEAQAAVDAGGELVGEGTLQKAILESKYGGVGGTLGAGAAGVARGLSIGLSDPALVGIGGEGMRERLNYYQEEHPVASIGGELVGAIAPALIPGAGEVEGAGLLARAGRAAGALNEGVGLAGRAAEGLATRIVGREAEGLAARVAQRAIAKGAEGAMMGALYGMGSGASQMALSEEHLGNPAEVASKLFSAGAHGALLGGALGGIVGGGEELGRAALKSAAVKAQPFLSAKADESAFKTLNARSAFTDKAAEIPGGSRAIGRQLLNDGVIEAGDTVAEVAPKVAKMRDKAGAAIDEKFASVAGNESVPLRDVLTKLETRAKEFDKKLGYEAAANELRTTKERLAEMYIPKATGVVDEAGAVAAKAAANEARVPLTELLDQRRAFEKTVNWNTETVLAQGKQAAGRALEDFVTEAADGLAKQKGMQTWAKEYKEAKLVYRRYALATEAVEDSLVRKEANAGHSLTDKIFAAHGALGAAAGVVSGHPGAIVGLAAGPVSKQIREKGSSVAAIWLDKLAQLGRVESASSNVQKGIDRGIEGFFGATRKNATPLRAAAEVDVPQWQKAIAAYKTDPSGAVERIATGANGIATHAPTVAKEYGAVARRALAFLASKLPDPSTPRSSPPPLLPGIAAHRSSEPPALNPQAEAQFARYVRGVDLETVAADFARGKLSYETLQTVREVHPEVFAKMQDGVREKLAKHKDTLDINQMLGLSLLFDIPVNWATTPDGIKTLQKAIAVNNAEEEQKKSQMGTGDGAAGQQAAETTMLPFEAREMRGQNGRR